MYTAKQFMKSRDDIYTDRLLSRRLDESVPILEISDQHSRSILFERNDLGETPVSVLFYLAY